MFYRIKVICSKILFYTPKYPAHFKNVILFVIVLLLLHKLQDFVDCKNNVDLLA